MSPHSNLYTATFTQQPLHSNMSDDELLRERVCDAVGAFLPLSQRLVGQSFNKLDVVNQLSVQLLPRQGEVALTEIQQAGRGEWRIISQAFFKRACYLASQCPHRDVSTWLFDCGKTHSLCCNVLPSRCFGTQYAFVP